MADQVTKLTQKYPLNWLAQSSFEIKGSEVIQFNRSLWGSWQRTVPIKDIGSSVGQSTSGNKAWDTFGWSLLGVGIALLILSRSILPLTVCFLLALLCFVIRFFLRETYTVFNNKNTGQPLFWIKHSKRGDEKHFIDELKRRVNI